MNYKYNNLNGLTLVETVIASFLVLLISLALLGAQLSARHLTRKGRIHMEATSVAQSLLEKEKSRPFANINSWQSNNVVVINNGTPGDSSDDIVGSVQVDVTDNGSTKRVNVTLSWSHIYFGAMRNSSVTLTTLVADI